MNTTQVSNRKKFNLRYIHSQDTYFKMIVNTTQVSNRKKFNLRYIHSQDTYFKMIVILS